MFCGREPELEMLMSAFRRVEAGDGPEVAVVLGESGLGKTRLVQEFYARLSTSIDAEGECGYWPDRMVRDGNNLKVNPDPAECNPSQVANMRFLWWGIRMLDRTGHNAGMGGLSESVPLLRAHLEPFARARVLSARVKDAAKSAAIDAAIEIGNLFTFGLLGLGRLGLDHASNWKAIVDERREFAGMDAAGEQARQRESLVDIVLADLEALFAAGEKKGEPLPAIILLDDAQWLSADEAAATFIARLLRRAETENWPLLVLATHWEKEWNDAEADTTNASLPMLLRGWDEARKTVIALGKEPDLEEMVEVGFPGLHPHQVKLVLRKAGGNPRLLDEVLRDLANSPAYFSNADLSSPLTGEGMDYLGAARYEIHQLVAKRLSQADPDLQLAIAFSGAQGLRFLPRLTDMAALKCSRGSACGRVREAERPHAFVTSVTDRVREFAQPFYRDVARERLPRLLSEEKAIAALRESVVELSGNDGSFETIEPDERDVALAVGCDLLAAKEASEAQRRLAARLFLRRMRSARARLEKDTAGELAFQLAIAAMDKRVERDAVEWAEWFEVVETLDESGRLHWSAAAARKCVEWMGSAPETLESRIVRCQMLFVIGRDGASAYFETRLKPEEVWDEVEAQVRTLIEECDDPRPRITLIKCLRTNSKEPPLGNYTKKEVMERTYEAFALAESLLKQSRSAENLKYSAHVLMDLALWAETEEERAQASKIALELARERETFVGPHEGRLLIAGTVLTEALSQRASGNLPKAIKRYLEVVELSEKTLLESDALSDMLILNWDRQRLAGAYLEAGDVDAALEQAIKTEALLDEMDKALAAQTALTSGTSFDARSINTARQLLDHIRNNIDKARAGDKLD